MQVQSCIDKTLMGMEELTVVKGSCKLRDIIRQTFRDAFAIFFIQSFFRRVTVSCRINADTLFLLFSIRISTPFLLPIRFSILFTCSDMGEVITAKIDFGVNSSLTGFTVSACFHTGFLKARIKGNVPVYKGLI